MREVRLIQALPPNIDRFIEENAGGLRGLYGPVAEAEYRDTACARMKAAAEMDHVDLLAAYEGRNALGMLMSSITDGFGRIHFIHVLEGCVGRQVECGLIREAVRRMRANSVEGIAAECIAFCPLEQREAFCRLGFQERERAVMIAHLPLPPQMESAEIPLRSATGRDRDRVASTLMAAYAKHPSRMLHPEMRSPASAAAFVRLAMSGGYGPAERGDALIAGNPNDPDGVSLSCRVAPDVGFVLHLAVRPDRQNAGVGSRLLCETARRFTRAGMTRIALGVTWDNPARRLYERFGFEVRHRLQAYAWWRDDAAWGGTNADAV